MAAEYEQVDTVDAVVLLCRSSQVCKRDETKFDSDSAHQRKQVINACAGGCNLHNPHCFMPFHVQTVVKVTCCFA